MKTRIQKENLLIGLLFIKFSLFYLRLKRQIINFLNSFLIFLKCLNEAKKAVIPIRKYNCKHIG